MKKFRFLAAILLLTIIIISAVSFAACKKPQSELPDGEDGISSGDINQGGDETTYEKGLSEASYDFDAEYFYSDYNAQVTGYQIFEDKEIVFQQIGYDELNYLLNSEGYYLILFGGSWCGNTQAAIGYINDLAKKYGISKIYNFDFRLDGGFDLDGKATSAAHIRENETSSVLGAQYNYLYGELVERYLTNLNDWVEYKEDGNSAVTWLHVDGTTKSTVAKVQVPFLFLYNKDNTTRYEFNSDKTSIVEAEEQTGEKYPIVYGFEEMVNRDADGVYVNQRVSGAIQKSYIQDEYLERLEGIFKFIDDNEIETLEYTDGQYFYEAYIYGNGRGHSPKLYDIFEEGEQINLKQITYRELVWLFEQEGNAVILFAGAWCANSTAVVGAINDYAIANDITVYVFDTRLDGKCPIDFWGYGRDRQFQIRETITPGSQTEPNPFAYLYVDLINKYIPNIEVLEGTISYVKDGNTVEAPRTQLPYLFSYNKDAIDEDGYAAPALAWYEEMLEVVAYDADIYFYKSENYQRYTQGIYDVISAYAERVGATAKHYTGTPRKPLV